MDIGTASTVGDRDTLDLSRYRRRYSGRHRALEMPKGIGLIPHGDRNRVKTEYGIDTIEERDSVDKYTKHIK